MWRVHASEQGREGRGEFYLLGGLKKTLADAPATWSESGVQLCLCTLSGFNFVHTGFHRADLFFFKPIIM